MKKLTLEKFLKGYVEFDRERTDRINKAHELAEQMREQQVEINNELLTN